MPDATALDVRITPSVQRLPDLKDFLLALRRLGTALDELDRAIVIERAPRPTWVVRDLAHVDGYFEVTLAAATEATRDAVSLLRPAVALVNGVRELETTSDMPAYYSELTIERLLQVAKPKSGIQEIALAARNGVREPWAPLTEQVISHARKSVKPAQQSIGSITGRLDELKNLKSGRISTRVFEERSRRTVTVSIPASSTDALRDDLRLAWTRRVTLRGRITRNAAGQAVKVAATRLELLPEDDAGIPTASDSLGAAREWTGDLTPDEFIQQRNRG